MDRQKLRDKFRGALLGVAIGDALGAPFEGKMPVDESILTKLEKEPGTLRYTDDTHMAIGMAESLLVKRGFDGPHMAETFARNYEVEPWRGYGAGPPQVFELLRRGVPWDQAGRVLFGGAGSYGNGAAMRVAPVALAYYYDATQLIEVARRSAIITHTHELGIQGALLQAFTVALLVEQLPDSRLSGSAVSELLISYLSDASASLYVHKIKEVKELLPDASPVEVASRVGNGIEAFQAVPAALYAFLSHAASFSQAVRYAISLGGDTDTIASMTGALSGAYLGESAIPGSWRENVEGAVRLREIADSLLDLALSRKNPGSEA
jgi:poly(ADP-ribose) glycohydrolase ARH3